MPRRLLAIAVSTLLLTACGHSSVTTVGPDADFTRLDTNADGVLTLQESQLPGLEFNALDQNHDGKLSLLEWEQASSDSTNVRQQQELQQLIRDQGHPTGPGSY